MPVVRISHTKSNTHTHTHTNTHTHTHTHKLTQGRYGAAEGREVSGREKCKSAVEIG